MTDVPPNDDDSHLRGDWENDRGRKQPRQPGSDSPADRLDRFRRHLAAMIARRSLRERGGLNGPDQPRRR